MSTSMTPTILCVDDDSMNRESLSMLLQLEGFQVREAANGNEGLNQARERPDLILLDVCLPDLSGFDVCQAIKANPSTSTIPIIQLSGHFMSGADRVQGLEGGADAYLTKPVEPRELVAHIRALLRVRRAEQAARLAARQWQTTFDAVQDGICLIDQAGQVIRCNLAMARLFGRAPEQLVGCPYTELKDRASRPAEQPPAEVSSAGQREVTELRLGQRWFRVTLDPTSDEEGTLIGRVAVWAEITERKRAEETIRRLAQIVESSDDAILGKTSEGVVTSWNQGAARMFGYSAEEMVGRSLTVLLPSDRPDEPLDPPGAAQTGRADPAIRDSAGAQGRHADPRLADHLPHPRCQRFRDRSLDHCPRHHSAQAPGGTARPGAEDGSGRAPGGWSGSRLQ